ncbi:MAG: acyl-CoA dehydrogenase family protein [Acidimicrobiia bacterium]
MAVLADAAAEAIRLLRVLSAAEAAGIGRACTEQAVECAKVREQFGRPIGSFQAIKHHTADMLVDAELAAAAAWDASRDIERGRDAPHLHAVVAAAIAIRPRSGAPR